MTQFKKKVSYSILINICVFVYFIFLSLLSIFLYVFIQYMSYLKSIKECVFFVVILLKREGLQCARRSTVLIIDTVILHIH